MEMKSQQYGAPSAPPNGQGQPWAIPGQSMEPMPRQQMPFPGQPMPMPMAGQPMPMAGQPMQMPGQQVYTGAPMQQQPGMVVVTQQPPAQPYKPNNYLVVAIIALFCNCPLGIIAVICATQSDSSYRNGKVDEARSRGNCALGWSIGGFIFTVLIVIVTIVVYYVLVIKYVANCYEKWTYVNGEFKTVCE